MKNKKFPGQGRWDRTNSTYKHTIHFTESQRVPFLDGYSKGILYKEMPDKIVLLETVITRLLNNGYLRPERTIRIDFFEKSFLNNNDELILSLYPGTYSVQNEKFLKNERITAFLCRMYAQIKSGKIISKDLIDKPVIKKEEDIFSLASKRFFSEPELLQFVIRKIKEGFPEGRVMQFFYKYKEKYLTA